MSDEPGDTALKIGLADDHPIMRSALASALSTLGPTRFVEASDATGTLAMLEAHPDLDLLLVDLRMPGADGTETIRALRARAPQVPLVVVSADEDRADVAALLGLGVSGYVPKSEPPAVIVSAVRLVLAGGIYVPPRLGTGARKVFHDQRRAGIAQQVDRQRTRRQRGHGQGAPDRRVPHTQRAQPHRSGARGAALPALSGGTRRRCAGARARRR